MVTRRHCELARGHTQRTSRALYVAFNLHSHHLSLEHYLSGQAHLQHSPKHPAASGGRYSHWAKEHLHNTAQRRHCIHQENFNRRRCRPRRRRHVWDGWHGKGEGEGRWLTHKTESYRYCLTCACHLFIHFSSSWYGRWHKPLLYDSAAHDTHRLAPIRAPFSIRTSSPFYRWHVRQRCGTSAHPFPFRSQAEHARPRPHCRSNNGLGWLGKDRGVVL